MRSIRSAVFIYNIVSIAVVGSKEYSITVFQTGSNNFFNAGIHGFHGFYYRVPNPGMPYHICIGKIQADKIR